MLPPDVKAVFPFNYTLIAIQLLCEGIRFLGAIGGKDVVLSATEPQIMIKVGGDLPIQSFHYTNETITTEVQGHIPDTLLSVTQSPVLGSHFILCQVISSAGSNTDR